MKKKLIGLALSAAMLFSVLSVPAFAAAPEESADPALTTEQTAAEEENCFFTSSSTEEEKEPNSITYVALGDSICAGIGLTKVQYSTNLTGVDVSFNFKGYPETCYVGQVGKSLNLDRDHAINLGLPGVMSKDMLELVKTGTMAEMNTLSGCQYNYPEFIDYIKSADVISLQLGSNDAFVPTVVSFGEATNWKSEQLVATMVSGVLREPSFENLQRLNSDLSRLRLTKEEKQATTQLLLGGGTDAICEQAYQEAAVHMPQVVAELRALNPDAQIILLGYTNPVPLLPEWTQLFRRLNALSKSLAAQNENVTYVPIPLCHDRHRRPPHRERA